ncbi:GNAT family N-acetyltransferase [Chitinimonas sp.]|uniref:GNAT family N-acetyltransferase n=1 Tax=Chitinimonas sp. TaxID=1934313 RepID=UPI002F92E69C
MSVLRTAVAADIPGIFDVRYAVTENTLQRGRISDEEVLESITTTGRGWVVEQAGHVVGFAIGNAQTGNIFALFVHPDHAGVGHGRRLHDAMVDWLWEQGLERLWLSTGEGTRAQGFYQAAGWQACGHTEQGEVRFERYKQKGEA